MHPCLEIPEIVFTIVELATIDNVVSSVERVDAKTALALLTTSRNFTGHATQMLWRNLSSLVPLLLAMPGGLLKRPDHVLNTMRPFTRPKPYEWRSYHTVIDFEREVVASDWGRFDFYARWVKTLGIEDGPKLRSSQTLSSYEFSQAVLHELKRRNKVLLPNLHSMTIDSHNLPYASLCLNQEVQWVTFKMERFTSENMAQVATRCIPQVGSGLRALHLQHSDNMTPALAEETGLASGLQNLLNRTRLEEFHSQYYPLTDEMVEKILAMPSIHSVTLRREVADLANLLPRVLHGEHQFRSFLINTFQFSASDVAKIIRSLRPSRLFQFAIYFEHGVCGSDQLCDIISTIDQSCSPDHFSQLNISPICTIRHPQDMSATPLEYKIIKPLLNFKKLKKLSLPSTTFHLSDAEIKTLAMAWPELTTLFLSDYPSGFAPKASPTALIHLATYCKQLIYLTFSFGEGGSDCSIPDDLDLAKNHGLKLLNVGCSRVNDEKEFATFLKTLFPELLFLFYRSEGEDYRRWINVHEELFP